MLDPTRWAAKSESEATRVRERVKLAERAKPIGAAAIATGCDFAHWIPPHHTERLRANALADECQVLRDENTKLLAENARLRREIERGRR